MLKKVQPYTDAADEEEKKEIISVRECFLQHNAGIQDEIENEFKEYIEFSENYELPRLILSPSKIEETERIFSKHKRFSLYPGEKKEEQPKQEF